MTSVYSLIREAILNKHQLIATYHEHHREMCPHVIGWKNGKEHALFYQFGGTSSRTPPSGWRCMEIEDLTGVSVRPGPWHTDHDHSRPQTCVDEIDVEVR